MTKTQLVLQENCGKFAMRDGAEICIDPRAGGQGWHVRSHDGYYLLARGEDAAETEWNLDRKTSFGTLEGAVEAWLRAYAKMPCAWKGQ